MNIYPFSTEVNYVLPDVKVIELSIETMLKQKAAAELAFEQTQYLPSVHAKARVLHTAMVGARQTVDEQLHTLETVTTKALGNLNMYRAELTDELSEEQRALNDYARKQTIITFKKALTPAVQDLQRQFKTLSEMEFDPALTMTYQDGLLIDLARLNTEMTATEEKMAAVEESREIINDAMALLEKGNFVDIAKDTLLTGESISALGLAAPEVELIKFAIDHMRKTLEHIGEAINYQIMYQQRELLIGKINTLKATVAECMADVKTITAKTELITSIHGLFDSFFSARAEYAKVDQSVNALVDHLAFADQTDYEDRLVAAAPSFIAYLKDAR